MNARIKLALHGFEGDTRHGGNVSSYNADSHDATERFDFVLGKPAFNEPGLFSKDDKTKRRPNLVSK